MALKRPITPEAARIRMADLCARSEQCEHDIRQKLHKTGLSADTISDTINYLTENKFIDNKRFAQSYARDKCRFSSWGPYKIRLALSGKRISGSDITQALNGLEAEEIMEAARKVAKVKERSLNLHGETAKDDRMKLYRHIISRGFSPDMAKTVTKEFISATKPNE
ncbi:MAG: regulatory protein RecX [Bacteroides sp.]|nr:regulatory protein RecX [Bacteroides sp.]